MNISKEQLIKKFNNEMETASWEMLDPHFKRDALIVINSKEHELVDIAVELALDNQDLFTSLIAKNLIYKPSLEDTFKWKSNKNNFMFLIVSPYVIVKIIEGS